MISYTSHKMNNENFIEFYYLNDAKKFLMEKRLRNSNLILIAMDKSLKNGKKLFIVTNFDYFKNYYFNVIKRIDRNFYEVNINLKNK